MKYLLILILVSLTSAMASETDQTWEDIHGDGVYTMAQEATAHGGANRISNEFERGGLPAIAMRTNQAIDAMMTVGELNLRQRGFDEDADWLRTEWQKYNGDLERIVSNSNRDIGDFKPVIRFLANAYDRLEARLGYKVCYALRLSDIKTINFTIPVVFAPCRYGLDEFTLHFVHDAKYRGLAPVVTYWATTVGCSVATFGAGVLFFICSPIGMLTEVVMDEIIAPRLAPKLYSAACE